MTLGTYAKRTVVRLATSDPGRALLRGTYRWYGPHNEHVYSCNCTIYW